MSSLVAAPRPCAQPEQTLRRRLIVRDSLWMTAVGQVERLVGLLITFSLRWGLSPAELGIYSGLRMLLDNTSRSSLGVALGAMQKAPLLRAAGRTEEADHVLDAAATANTLTSSVYGLALVAWGCGHISQNDHKWGVGLILVGLLAVMKRWQDFQIATMRSESKFTLVGRLALVQSFVFAISGVAGVYLFGFWGLMASLGLTFVAQSVWIEQSGAQPRFKRAWDLRLVFRLAATGFPILAASSAWAMLNTFDKALILTHMPDGATQAGYYTMAILATNWCGDVAGRVGLVLYPSYQRELGQGATASSILEEAETASLFLLVALTGISLWAYAAGWWFLPRFFPKLGPGLHALGPMLPGAVALAATWPLRQAWIACNRPWPLAAAAAVVACFEYLSLQKTAISGTIADVAEVSSQFQLCATLLLFGMSAMRARWHWRRMLQSLFATFAIAYWVGLAWFCFGNGWQNIFSDFSSADLFTALAIGSAPVGFVVMLFYRNEKRHHGREENQAI